MRQLSLLALCGAFTVTGCQLGDRVEECNSLAGALNDAPRFEVSPDADAKTVAKKFESVGKQYEELAARTKKLSIQDSELQPLQKKLVDTFDAIANDMARARTARLDDDPIRYEKARTSVQRTTKKAKRLAKQWQRICKK